MERNFDSRHLYNYRKFNEYLQANVPRERYKYVMLKHSDNIFHLVSGSSEDCQWLRETIGYFFQGTEITYLVIEDDGSPGE